mmetsp:Transcript_97328/g.275761  ORF Transcript_97328/g.275761 Transcript_97328/m.275761 type:complete len:224 (+) Transcript_97328:116-787(+)
MSAFQVKLESGWQNFDDDADRILKRAYEIGFPQVRYTINGEDCWLDFVRMSQLSPSTSTARRIRPPASCRQPFRQKGGPAITVVVPKGAAGHTISVPHPSLQGKSIAVAVPAAAVPGHRMLVPVPGDNTGQRAPRESRRGLRALSGKRKAMLGCMGIFGMGGIAVAGVVLGDEVAAEGWAEAAGSFGEGMASAGDEIADVVGIMAEGAGDAADSAADAVLDLF